jgi:hypothetical protein
MTDQEFAIAYLKAVEKKHNDYFVSANLNIMKCVVVTGTNLVTVINKDLPKEIRYDIEEMFWVE